jgi:hypothetical protein
MRCLALAVLVMTGCVYFDSDDDDDSCVVLDIAPAPLRNPDTLQCETFGGGCDPACGPCPAVANQPLPSWPVCGSPCESLDPSACAADPSCRVVEDAACSIGLNCFTNFVGCYPIDTVPSTSIDCYTADAWDCSRDNACTAYHSYETCPTDAECDRPFELCTPEGQAPGRCHDPVVCDRAPPACGTGKVPGVLNGCYTGACIPVHLCEAM